jgi:hypothetical protein
MIGEILRFPRLLKYRMIEAAVDNLGFNESILREILQVDSSPQVTQQVLNAVKGAEWAQVDSALMVLADFQPQTLNLDGNIISRLDSDTLEHLLRSARMIQVKGCAWSMVGNLAVINQLIDKSTDNVHLLPDFLEWIMRNCDQNTVLHMFECQRHRFVDWVAGAVQNRVDSIPLVTALLDRGSPITPQAFLNATKSKKSTILNVFIARMEGRAVCDLPPAILPLSAQDPDSLRILLDYQPAMAMEESLWLEAVKNLRSLEILIERCERTTIPEDFLVNATSDYQCLDLLLTRFPESRITETVLLGACKSAPALKWLLERQPSLRISEGVVIAATATPESLKIILDQLGKNFGNSAKVSSRITSIVRQVAAKNPECLALLPDPEPPQYLDFMVLMGALPSSQSLSMLLKSDAETSITGPVLLAALKYPISLRLLLNSGRELELTDSILRQAVSLDLPTTKLLLRTSQSQHISQNLLEYATAGVCEWLLNEHPDLVVSDRALISASTQVDKMRVLIRKRSHVTIDIFLDNLHFDQEVSKLLFAHPPFRNDFFKNALNNLMKTLMLFKPNGVNFSERSLFIDPRMIEFLHELLRYNRQIITEDVFVDILESDTDNRRFSNLVVALEDSCHDRIPFSQRLVDLAMLQHNGGHSILELLRTSPKLVASDEAARVLAIDEAPCLAKPTNHKPERPSSLNFENKVDLHGSFVGMEAPMDSLKPLSQSKSDVEKSPIMPSAPMSDLSSTSTDVKAKGSSSDSHAIFSGPNLKEDLTEESLLESNEPPKPSSASAEPSPEQSNNIPELEDEGADDESSGDSIFDFDDCISDTGPSSDGRSEMSCLDLDHGSRFAC